MLRISAILFFCLTLNHILAQSKKHFNIEESNNGLIFHFNSPSGKCTLKATDDNHPINIYGYSDDSKVKSMFYNKIVEGINHVFLDLEGKDNADFSSSVSFGLFSNEPSEENNWKVYLSNKNEFGLDLSYGAGEADVDLSGLSINKLNLNSGSASVIVGYHEGFANNVSMDTFKIKMGFGSVILMNANLAKAKNMIADIGFGNLKMDLSEHEIFGSMIDASIGAGSLTVNVPPNNVPVKVIVNSSPLCRISFSNDFKEIEQNVYINKAYHSDIDSAFEFNLDVALGSITFTTKP